MTCRECIEFLGRYLGDELPERQRATFDAHLAECPQCIHYLDAYRRTVELAQATAEPGLVPDDLVRAILAARST